jgi:hypothetical protein
LETKQVSQTKTITSKDTTGEEFDVTFSFDERRGRLEVTSLTVSAKSDTGIVTQAFVRNLSLVEPTLAVRAAHHSTDTADLAPLTVQKWKASEEQLQLVARLYREAYKQGTPVQKYLASKVGRPLPTVNRWVGIARDKGYLGSALGTKAGEA